MDLRKKHSPRPIAQSSERNVHPLEAAQEGSRLPTVTALRFALALALGSAAACSTAAPGPADGITKDPVVVKTKPTPSTEEGKLDETKPHLGTGIEPAQTLHAIAGGPMGVMPPVPSSSIKTLTTAKPPTYIPGPAPTVHHTAGKPMTVHPTGPTY